MFHDYDKLFATLELPAPRPELVRIVLARIAAERRQAAVRRVVAFAAVSLGALSALVLSGRELLLEVSQSGFAQLSTLVLSDATLVASYWQDYVFSLLETLPALSAAVVLGTSLAMLAALGGLISSLTVILERPALRSL
jgi:ABC-type phosphate/phosphonate transport system permease subunit